MFLGIGGNLTALRYVMLCYPVALQFCCIACSRIMRLDQFIHHVIW